jgi:hypothetical protein
MNQLEFVVPTMLAIALGIAIDRSRLFDKPLHGLSADQSETQYTVIGNH